MRWLLAGIVAIAAGLLIPPIALGSEVTLYNHSFEEEKLTVDPDKLPKPTGWIWTGDSDTGTTFERVADPEAPDGDWVLKVNSSGFEGLGGVHSPSLDVEPNQTYTIRMMVKVPVGRPFWRAISERKANDEQLAFDEATPSMPYIGTGQWELLEYTRAFGNGEKIRGYWRMGGTSGEPGTFYLDKVPPPPPPKPVIPIGPPAPTTPVVDPAPVVSGFGVTKRRFASVGTPGPRKLQRGTRFTYTLSEQASVVITITRRSVSIATLSARKQAGPRSTAFSGRGRGAPLKPGSYQARIVATDSAGQASEPRYANFTIVGD